MQPGLRSANVALFLVLLPPWARGAAPQTVMVPMSDGVRLATDVYLPPGTGRFAAILARTPYGRTGLAAVAGQATQRGYAFVAQDTRGRFQSEGANRAFEADGWTDGHADGRDTVDWIAKQSWSSGKIGTWGASALGITQLLMAGAAPADLTCQWVVVATPSMYRGVVFRGGAPQTDASRWLQLSGFDPAQKRIWSEHPTEDAYWQERDLANRWGKVNVPAVHVGGWYDLFTQGTLDAFMGYQYKGGPGARGRQKLIVGPWPHGAGTDHVGDVTFPHGARPPEGTVDEWRWYAHWLQGVANGVEATPAVTYYVMGDTTDPSAPGNVWRTADRWPVPATPTPWYLSSAGILSPRRTLAKEGSRAYTYDPANPVPTSGGNHLLLPPGPKDQRAVEARPDVLLFTSAPLAAPLEVTGRVTARLWVSSDAPDTDFVARLCDVYPDGRSLNICEGILRARYRTSFSKPELMRPGSIYRVDVDMWSTSMVFNKGHRLRLQVTSSNAPAYEPNPNTGAAYGAARGIRVAHNRIWMEAARPSSVVLPVVGTRLSVKERAEAPRALTGVGPAR